MKCYEYYTQCNKTCKKNKCRYWVDHKRSSNCIVVKSKEKTSTLQEIGEIFGITRMRVCQIEKTILKKIKKRAYEALHLNVLD